MNDISEVSPKIEGRQISSLYIYCTDESAFLVYFVTKSYDSIGLAKSAQYDFH